MRRSILAMMILSLGLAACDGGGGGDDDDDDRVALEFSDFEEAPLGECEIVGSVFNTSDDRTCDVFIRHEAIDFDGFVIGDAVSTVTALSPDTGADFADPILDDGGDFVFCDEVERIEVEEFEENCD